MDSIEALRRWLRRAYMLGETTARLESPLRRGKITLAEALGVLERVLDQAELLDAGPVASSPGVSDGEV